MGKITLSIDPGVRNVGVAVFEDGKLLWADCLKAPKAEPLSKQIHTTARLVQETVCRFEIQEIIAEWPQVYRQSKGDPNDLLSLVGVLSYVSGLFTNETGAFYTVLPREWKGQLPANVCARRILSKLDSSERDVLKWLPTFEVALTKAEENKREISNVLHNAVDAVGIGLHFFNRFGKTFRKG